MGVNIDEARSEYSPGPVDNLRSGGGPPRLDGRYASVTDGDIDGSRRASGAVDDCGAADQQIVHAFPPANNRFEPDQSLMFPEDWSNSFVNFQDTGSRPSLSLSGCGRNKARFPRRQMISHK